MLSAIICWKFCQHAFNLPMIALHRVVLTLCVLIAVAVFGAGTPHAQLPVPGQQEGKAAVEPSPSTSDDPLGRHTPEGLVTGLLKAMADEDYSRAAQFLDLRSIPAPWRQQRGIWLARQLQELLDKGGWVAAGWQLSDNPAGQQDDRLPPNQERFATVRTPDGMVSLIAERTETELAGRIWLVSTATIEQVPILLERSEHGLLDELLPSSLTGNYRIGNVPLAHWVALLALAAVAYLVAWVFTFLIARAIHRIWRRSRSVRMVHFIDAAILPFRIYLAVWVFAISALFLGASIVARQQFGYLAELVAWLALGWFLWRIVDAASEIGGERMSLRSQFGALSAIRFFRRATKFVIAAIAGIAVFDTIGFDVTAGLAALGIGGLAIALGAQKTVENLVGSLTLIADQPVRVGDFCRIGDTRGTIEDIGMRSTRIRTLDRTVVTVPNGELSSLQIENYSKRDRFWFHPVLGLRYETTPDQIRYLLVELRSLLYAHQRVDPDPARVRFLGMGESCLSLEIFAYVQAANYGEFLEVQEDLTLRIMDIVAESGASFAFPSQTLYMTRDVAPAQEKRQAAEAQVRAWSDKGELQLPRFQPERIEALRNSLAYPPNSSTSRNAETSNQATTATGTASTQKAPQPGRKWWRR